MALIAEIRFPASIDGPMASSVFDAPAPFPAKRGPYTRLDRSPLSAPRTISDSGRLGEFAEFGELLGAGCLAPFQT